MLVVANNSPDVVHNVVNVFANSVLHCLFQQIFVLMRTDSYPKFLRSPVFQEWMTLEVSGDPLPCDTAAEKKAKASQKVSILPSYWYLSHFEFVTTA